MFTHAGAGDLSFFMAIKHPWRGDQSRFTLLLPGNKRCPEEEIYGSVNFREGKLRDFFLPLLNPTCFQLHAILWGQIPTDPKPKQSLLGRCIYHFNRREDNSYKWVQTQIGLGFGGRKRREFYLKLVAERSRIAGGLQRKYSFMVYRKAGLVG